MEAQELRIGNLLLLNNSEFRPRETGKVITVTAVSTDTLKPSIGCKVDEYTYFGQFIEYLEPIPLTDEWLIKAGFERQKQYMGRVYNKSIMQLQNEDDGWVDGYDTVIPLTKYVHQLQNLYFALTGKELDIKP